MDKIRSRDRDAIIQSLRSGVVPRVGLQHVQVGRKVEIENVMKDLDRLADGGSSFRLVIGEYGSGKTFFLSLARLMALQKKLVVANADLNPDRRLHASGGQGRSLYVELMRNIATQGRPDGGAISGIVEKFISSADEQAKGQDKSTEQIIAVRLKSLQEMVGGYDFAAVINLYWKGHQSGNEQLMSNAERWLRGEFATKTDARSALGVRTIVDDGSVYDFLKLMARFVRLAGYSGLLIQLDELVNLYKLGSSHARASNYEQILRILNDSLQGSTEGLGFILGGTPEFLVDTRRGLYSYPALATRLAENSFAHQGYQDHSGPVIRLKSLVPEDVYILLGNLRRVFAGGDESKYLVPDEALEAFLAHSQKKIGEAYFRTPRTTIKSFLDMLAVLDQNPETKWSDMVEKAEVLPDTESDLAPEEDDDGLTALRI